MVEVNVKGIVFEPEPYEDGFRLDQGAVFVYAEPLFESNLRIGFAVLRTFRSNDSLVLSDRFNLTVLAQRRRYLRELKQHEVELREGALEALGQVVSEAQHSGARGSPRKPFEHSNNQATEPAASMEDLAAAADDLLSCRDVLSRVGEAAAQRGYAGDTRPVRLVYLSIASRSLSRPQNTALVSESASGKNATIDAARELHPPEAVVEIRAGSARAVIYSDLDYAHKVILFAEADSIPDDGSGASAIRSLAADNFMAYDVVETDPDTKKFTTRHIEKPGPTGLLTTSTRSVAAQLTTRLLEIGLSDDENQTRAVMRAHALKVRPPSGKPPSLAPWQAFGRYIALRATELRGVYIPFAEKLAELLPARAVRMRRDFRQLLTVIETSALLHINHRAIADGWVVASIAADYATARDLLAPSFDSLAAEGLTPAVRQTVEAVHAGETDVSQTELAKRLGLTRSTVSWRVRKATEGGWLIDDAPEHARRKRLKRGEPLPENRSALPEVDELQRLFECSNATGGEGTRTTHALAFVDEIVAANGAAEPDAETLAGEASEVSDSVGTNGDQPRSDSRTRAASDAPDTVLHTHSEVVSDTGFGAHTDDQSFGTPIGAKPVTGSIGSGVKPGAVLPQRWTPLRREIERILSYGNWYEDQVLFHNVECFVDPRMAARAWVRAYDRITRNSDSERPFGSSAFTENELRHLHVGARAVYSATCASWSSASV
jgi:hypothetical protein